MRRRKWGRISLVVIVTMVAAMGMWRTSETLAKKAYFFGHGTLNMADEWMKVTDRAIHYYCEDNGWKVITQNPDTKATEQIKQMRYLVSLGVDGIIWSPVDPVATAGVAEYCKEQGVPTITYNTDVRSDAVPITIMFGSKKVAMILAEKVVEHLKQTYGEPKGLIISLQGKETVDTDRERAAGFKEVFSKYPGINLIEYFTVSRMEVAASNTFNAIQQYGRPVAIVAQNTTNGRAGCKALERLGMLVPRGEKGHVFVACIGGAPSYLDMMKKGLVDLGYVQPNLFYGPLALHFLKVVIEQGEDALPAVGTILTEDDLKITGGVHEINPWKDQAWAPAEVGTHYGHRWLKVRGMLVTPENVDDQRIWGNAARAWLK